MSAWCRWIATAHIRCASVLRVCCVSSRRNQSLSIRSCSYRAASTKWGRKPMRDDLHLYYEKELGFLRQMGVAFKKEYSLEAKRLALEPDKCEDPHVERLIECFAF